MVCANSLVFEFFIAFLERFRTSVVTAVHFLQNFGANVVWGSNRHIGYSLEERMFNLNLTCIGCVTQ